jgi:hypothetical protein
MVRRRTNPFAEQKKRLRYKALLRRDDPLRPPDSDELEAVKLSIASGGDYLSYAGNRGDEIGCTVFCFDSEEKARAMQAWLDASGITDRPKPESPPDFPQLKVG